MQLPHFDDPNEMIAFVQIIRDMRDEGYSAITRREVALYDLLGSVKFASIADNAFRYTCMYARFKRFPTESERFNEIYIGHRRQITDIISDHLLENPDISPDEFLVPEVDKEEIYRDVAQQ